MADSGASLLAIGLDMPSSVAVTLVVVGVAAAADDPLAAVTAPATANACTAVRLLVWHTTFDADDAGGGGGGRGGGGANEGDGEEAGGGAVLGLGLMMIGLAVGIGPGVGGRPGRFPPRPPRRRPRPAPRVGVADRPDLSGSRSSPCSCSEDDEDISEMSRKI